MDPPRSPSPLKEPQNPRNWPQKIPQRGRTQLRNRRYAALRELIKEGDYFSEERMRLRAPRLYHHYIGRFRRPQHPQNSPQKPQNPPKNPQNVLNSPQHSPEMSQIEPKMAPSDPKMAEIQPKMAPALRELLLAALEEGEAEDEEDEDEEDEDEDEAEQPPDEAEQELLRLEFTSRMHQNFLEGLDGDFDYSQVDEDPSLEALDLLSQDLEDRYFDEEEPAPAPPLL